MTAVADPAAPPAAPPPAPASDDGDVGDPKWDAIPGQELPEPALVVTIISEAGFGKTHLAATFRGPLVFLDSEARADRVVRKFRNAYLKCVFNYEQIVAAITWAVRKLKSPGTIVFDSGSDIRDMIQDHVLAEAESAKKKVHHQMGWSLVYEELTKLLTTLRAYRWNVVFTARVGAVYENDKKTAQRGPADFVTNKLVYHSDFVLWLEKDEKTGTVYGKVLKNGDKKLGTYRERLEESELSYAGIIKSMADDAQPVVPKLTGSAIQPAAGNGGTASASLPARPAPQAPSPPVPTAPPPAPAAPQNVRLDGAPAAKWVMNDAQAAKLTDLATKARLSAAEKESLPAHVCGQAIQSFDELNEHQYNRLVMELEKLAIGREQAPALPPIPEKTAGTPATANGGARTGDPIQAILEEEVKVVSEPQTPEAFGFALTGSVKSEMSVQSAGLIAHRWFTTFHPEVMNRYERMRANGGKDPGAAPEANEQAAKEVGRKCISRLADAGWFRKPGIAAPDLVIELEMMFTELGVANEDGWAELLSRKYAIAPRILTEANAKSAIASLVPMLTAARAAAAKT